MTDVVLIDWLGRGGTAQVTETWRRVLLEAEIDAVVVSRESTTMSVDHDVVKRVGGLVGALDAHLRLARRAASVIRTCRPKVVFVQNYWIPPIEMLVARATREAGSRLVLAVHNHRPHNFGGGSSAGLGRLLSAADDLMVHSRFVGNHVEAGTSRRVRLVELPLPLGVVETAPMPIPELDGLLDGTPTAVLFGVLGKRYKGGRTLRGLSDELHSKWNIVAAGVGAGRVEGITARMDRFLTESELRWLLSQADVTLAPYRSASQSAVVMLGQALGAPPVATPVGGIPEQIEDERTGLLVPTSATVGAWAAALTRIEAQPSWWQSVQAEGASAAEERHGRAVAAFLELAGR